MSVRIHPYPVLAMIFLAVGWLDVQAVEPAPESPETSPPQADTASTNLNQIGMKRSPLSDLESRLKKPFESFDRGSSSEDLSPASTGRRYVPPAPVLSNKKLKDLLEKRAEAMYLLPDDKDSTFRRDALLPADEGALDPTGRLPKSELDRYYDRIDRQKLGTTNQSTRNLDLFGRKTDPEDKDDVKTKPSGGLFGGEPAISARAFGQLTNSNSGGGFLSSEPSGPRSFGEIFGLGPAETSRPKDRARDTRLEEFKRMLDGPGFGSRNEFNVAPPPSASTPSQVSKPVLGVPGSSFSVAPQLGAGSALGDSSGFAGAIGTPVGVPDYAKGTPSLTPTPPLQKATPRPPPPTFNVPRRSF